MYQHGQESGHEEIMTTQATEYRTAVLPCKKTSLLTEKGEHLHDVIDEYAADHDLWIDDFLDAWPRMQANGYTPEELKDGPESSWLGYASLQGIIILNDFRFFRNCILTEIGLMLKKFNL